MTQCPTPNMLQPESSQLAGDGNRVGVDAGGAGRPGDEDADPLSMEKSLTTTSLSMAQTSSRPRSPSLEDRLARLFAMAARANAESTSRLSTSPRFGRHHCARLSTPSPRVSQAEQVSKKRKSPSITMPFFRSPLSRMLLSPRMQLPQTHMRSPSVRDIDLNVEPENSQEIVESGPHVPENAVSGSPVPENAESVSPVLENASNPDGAAHAQQNAQRNIVPNEKRRAIFEALLARATNGEVSSHVKAEVSIQFSVHIRTIQRIWKQGKRCMDSGLLVDVSSAKSKCGRKKIELNVSTLKDLPLSSRSTLADVATHFGVSKSKVRSMKKEGIIKRVSNTLKPYLMEKNKKDRLKWCLSMLDPLTLPHDPKFKGLFDHVVIDEKWWFITRKTQRYYTAPGEVEPNRTIKNKNYIPKIQILTAVGRPRFDSDGNCIFDGKIGCWAFVTYEPAKRSSVNRPAGTIEMKPIESITKDVMRAFVIEKVLPAIRAKWPREDASKPIFIQQDNAKPHVSPNDRLFCEAAKHEGFDIRIVCQPANSPDLNVLDLGFFNSLQSIQHKNLAKTTEELVTIVNTAFEGYSVGQLNRIFLTLHGCMEEVIKIGGDNAYDIPHIRKEMLERQGLLPLQLKCDAPLVQQAMVQLNE